MVCRFSGRERRVLKPFLVGLAAHKSEIINAYEITGSILSPDARVTGRVLTVKKLLAPLSREDVKIVRCLGLNYADHAVRSPH
jgi:hypothetical protein